MIGEKSRSKLWIPFTLPELFQDWFRNSPGLAGEALPWMGLVPETKVTSSVKPAARADDGQPMPTASARKPPIGDPTVPRKFRRCDRCPPMDSSTRCERRRLLGVPSGSFSQPIVWGQGNCDFQNKSGLQ